MKNKILKPLNQDDLMAMYGKFRFERDINTGGLYRQVYVEDINMNVSVMIGHIDLSEYIYSTWISIQIDDDNSAVLLNGDKMILDFLEQNDLNILFKNDSEIIDKLLLEFGFTKI